MLLLTWRASVSRLLASFGKRGLSEEADSGYTMPVHLVLHPGGRHIAQWGPVHGLQDTFQWVQRADGRQNVGGIDASRAPAPHPAARVAGREEGIEETGRRHGQASGSENYCSEAKLNPGSVSSRLKAYFQLIQRRTASCGGGR